MDDCWTLLKVLMMWELLYFPWLGLCQRREQLPVLWIMPLSSEPAWGNVTAEVMPAVQLALQHLSKQPAPLRNYELQFHFADSKCDNARALKGFFEAIFYGPKYLTVFGGLCSSATSTIAQSLQAFNLPQLSFAATAPAFANKSRYPNFFRVVPSDSAVNPALLKLLSYYGWRRVGTLTQQEERFTEVQKDLTEILNEVGVELAEAQWFFGDPCSAVKTLKENDVRIVIGQFDEFSAAKVFCCVYQLGMFGHKYQWILSGWSQTSWWTHTGTSNCSAQSILNAMEGTVSVDFETLSSRHTRGVSGRTPQEYKREYERRCMLKGLGSSKFHGFAYDGTWVLAKALTEVMEMLKYREKYSIHRNLTITDREVTHMILQALGDTKFFGVTGHVLFRNGERVANIKFAQFQAGKEVQVGEYSAITDRLVFASPIWFKGHEYTRDHTHIYPQRMEINIILYSILASISALGILMSIACLFFIILNHGHRSVQISSPSLNTLLILGTLLSYSSVFLFGLDGSYVSEGVFDALCSVRIWFITIGYTTAFGTMFAKIWRVYSMFNHISAQKRIIKDHVLFRIVCGLLLVDVCFLIILQVLDPLRRLVEEFSLEADPDLRDFAIRPFLEHCENSYMNIWMAFMYLSKSWLVLLSCVLAWKTHPPNTLVLSDCRWTRISVCLTGPLSVIGACVGLLTRDQPNVQFCVLGIVIITCCSVTLSLTFVPKLILMRTNPDGASLPEQFHTTETEKERECVSEVKERMKQRESSASSCLKLIITSPLEVLQSDNQHLTRHIIELNWELEELARQLRELSALSYRSIISMQESGELTGTEKCQTLPTGYSGKDLEDINSPEQVQRRLSLQLPILHHAYLLSIGGVNASCSTPSSPSAQHMALMGLWH
ncbi:gamma-aminobutyric acid type B receptor subunit 2 isoform X2 [Astyanax mexicanus]|uniref:gamma-aminobutyric acid type B receptor subunit 2 isoform X2 n=1 Tax=Astyanax mexicanus TaxID=7994 RepID=UPI0020CB32AE|nr:gamma-aminobutyric acid type B receptor subunit 2 isoform X2 [Astyanax mexicanus]